MREDTVSDDKIPIKIAKKCHSSRGEGGDPRRVG